MPSAYDIYTFYLGPADLKGQSHPVKVSHANVQPLYDPNLKRNIPRIVLSFENRKKVLVLNKTQVAALIEITHTDDYSQWVGIEFTLTLATAPNRRDTIAISSKTIAK